MHDGGKRDNSQNGSLTKSWLSTWCCWEAAVWPVLTCMEPQTRPVLTCMEPRTWPVLTCTEPTRAYMHGATDLTRAYMHEATDPTRAYMHRATDLTRAYMHGADPCLHARSHGPDPCLHARAPDVSYFYGWKARILGRSDNCQTIQRLLFISNRFNVWCSQHSIDLLNVQIDQCESELEAFAAKKKKPDKDVRIFYFLGV